MRHLTTSELEAGLDHILGAPESVGTLDLIVRRPAVDEREILDVGELDQNEGLIGDNWQQRGSSKTEDGRAHPEMQLNIMNSRVIELVAQDRTRWALAGDQLYIDLDISYDNLPAGTRLSLGTAVIEITDEPHTGCAKFTQRFGLDAMRFVNSAVGKRGGFRGRNAKVVEPGSLAQGDKVHKLS